MPEEPYFVEVSLPLAIPKTLTYQVPNLLAPQLHCGSRVIVPLSHKKILTGIVITIHQTKPSYETKPILDILDNDPLVTPKQIVLFQWIADYYMCSLGEVLKAALPSGFRLSSQSIIYKHHEWEKDDQTFSSEANKLFNQLTPEKGYPYQEAEVLLGKQKAYKVVKELLKANAIKIEEEIKAKYTPKKETHVRLAPEWITNEDTLRNLFEQLEKKPHQLAVLLQYLSYAKGIKNGIDEEFSIEKKKLIAGGISNNTLQSLIKKDIFVEKKIIIPRIEQIAPDSAEPIILSPHQETALQAIEEKFLTHKTVVLHGVTGSGKTEIYALLIQQILEAGGQVLYLLPEIGLATQIVQRLKKKFRHIIGIYHSKYSSNERIEIWNQLLTDKIKLVIGARSALFLPFNQLKLIIVDEEHDAAYKQSDSTPRYNARDSALMLAQLHQANVLLGSATPSLESYYRAKKGKYGLVTLTERFQQAHLPEIQLINIRTTKRTDHPKSEFSKELLESIQAALKKNEQVIIFKNRRGYASYLLCEACAWIPSCKQCSVSLTYHQYKNCLVCHYCGYHSSVPKVCPHCQNTSLKHQGGGTEKIEEALAHHFPGTKIARMDLETTRKKDSYQQIIQQFEKGATDILVGTQMVTKGLDFGKVTVVGIVDIDGLLHFPDFRSNERCFQLVTQVGGRAGRRQQQGQVIIQTKNPTHPLLVALKMHHDQKIYIQELIDRQTFRYPPYVRLIKVTFQHVYETVAIQAGNLFKRSLAFYIPEHNLLGPETQLIAKIRNLYRVDLLIKLEQMDHQQLQATKVQLVKLKQELNSNKLYRAVHVIFDVDPL